MTTDIVSTETALAISAGEPKEVVARAQEMADALKDVIASQHLFVKIRGKQHVFVEAWTTLGAMVGVFPSIEWTKPMEDSTGAMGWEARCVVSTPSGSVIGAAEAQCTRAETTWKNREDYMLRSMAQTRAVSKAMRVPLSWVMTLAGYEATPAEEMPRDTADDSADTEPNIDTLRVRTLQLLKSQKEPFDLKLYLEEHAANTIADGNFDPKLLTREQCEEITADLEATESEPLVAEPVDAD